jgi:hypothetical protein
MKARNDERQMRRLQFLSVRRVKLPKRRLG